jgi:hypothetical protein
MRRDQIFVLLLIVLIPMTGCFDNSVGDAQAGDADDVEMTHQEQLFSLHLLANDNHTVTVNGTSLKIDSSFHSEISGLFRTEAGAWLRHHITCGSEYSIEVIAYTGDTIPVLGGIECQIEITSIGHEVIVIYEEVEIAELE